MGLGGSKSCLVLEWGCSSIGQSVRLITGGLQVQVLPAPPLTKGISMKFRLMNGGLSVDNDAQAMEKLVERINTITQAIELFNQSDWKLEEVAMWLQYEKDLALVESKLYTQEKQQ